MSYYQEPPGSAQNAATRKSASQIAEQVVGEVTWMSETKGYCECPGRAQHTNQSGRRDGIVYLDHVPTLHCVHESCASTVERKNRELREAMRAGYAAGSPEPSARELKRIKEVRQRCERIRVRAAKSLPVVLKRWRWPYAEIATSSPTPIPEARIDQTRMLLGAFKPGDIVWIGDRSDSGQPDHSVCFKSVEEWSRHVEFNSQLVCPVAFKPGIISRSNENVVARRFLVVESDSLSKDEVGAVFRWLRDVIGLELVAVIDTAGKSLHAWFVWPGEDHLDDMKLVLPALGCDPKLFTASQPVRLAGGLRDGKVQSLVYFNQGGAL